MSIKVITADDHEIVRLGLKNLIKTDGSVEIVAEAEDGLQAFDKINKLKPDIAILDISMPNMNGIEVARKIQKENIKVEVIILTMHTGREYFKEAMDCGVKGYILKENATQDLITAIKFVSAGKHFISPQLTEHLIGMNKELTSLQSLSISEKRIIKLISRNKTSKEIAHELSLSFRTVQNHRSNICKKLDINGPNALLQFAIQNKPHL
ncbi:MAG: response regulator transcription factor [Candidatus Pacebacteria bacterium]|nr:response regulator transcription factor [Candidatus Paceibacterota bacterium]